MLRMEFQIDWAVFLHNSRGRLRAFEVQQLDCFGSDGYQPSKGLRYFALQSSLFIVHFLSLSFLSCCPLFGSEPSSLNFVYLVQMRLLEPQEARSYCFRRCLLDVFQVFQSWIEYQAMRYTLLTLCLDQIAMNGWTASSDSTPQLVCSGSGTMTSELGAHSRSVTCSKARIVRQFGSVAHRSIRLEWQYLGFVS